MRFLYNCVNRYKSASFRTPNQTNLSNPKRKARTPSNLTSLRSTHPSRRLARYIPRLAPRREIYIFGRFSEKARARARTYAHTLALLRNDEARRYFGEYASAFGCWLKTRMTADGMCRGFLATRSYSAKLAPICSNERNIDKPPR